MGLKVLIRSSFKLKLHTFRLGVRDGKSMLLDLEELLHDGTELFPVLLSVLHPWVFKQGVGVGSLGWIFDEAQ